MKYLAWAAEHGRATRHQTSKIVQIWSLFALLFATHPFCEGLLCYDSCLGRFIFLRDSNTCVEYFDPARFCWAVYGTCEEKAKSVSEKK